MSVPQLCQPSPKNLLYGDPNKAQNENKQIMLSVYSFFFNKKINKLIEKLVGI